MALTKIVDTFRVDETDSGPFDAQVHVQALTDGGFVYAWRERDLDGVGQIDRVYVRKFDANGDPVGDQFEIPGALHGPGEHANNGGSLSLPSIAALAGGGFAVEYNDYNIGTDRTNGTHYSSPTWTWVATFDAAGALLGQTAPLGQPIQGDAVQSSATWNSVIGDDGDTALVQYAPWLPYPGNRIVINGVQVVQHEGIPSNATEGYNLSSGSIDVADHADGAIAIYVRQYYTGSTEGSEIWAVTSTGFEYQVNQVSAGNQSFSSTGDFLAQLSDGNYVAVWDDTNTTTDEATDPDYGVHARIFRGDGTYVTGDIVLSITPNGNEDRPAVAAMSGGRWIAAWQDDGGVVAQVFSATGERLGDQVVLGIAAADDTLTLTVLADDRIVFAFNDGGSTTSSQIWRFPDIFGTEAGEAINGTSGDDVIHGLGGNDTINGRAGVDTMSGGAGDDTYYAYEFADQVLEAVGGGNDTVITYTSHVLGAGQEVETLRTPGSASTSTINLTGNELANTLLGNAGTNTLNGGAGADYLRGYAGNDTYWVDNAGDQVIEASGGGSDTVIAAASFALGTGQEVETLRTLGSATTYAINLTGNAIANTIFGNAAANTLNGGGEADYMRGYAGDDTYHVDNAADQVIEAAGGGSDTVIAKVSYTLAAGQEIETLRTLGSGSTDVVDFTGNALANALYGNAAANVLDGKGGTDTLRGYAGSDTFSFTTALGAGNVDTILFFSAAEDTIAIDDAVFTGLGLGALPAGAFRIGTAAADADDRIIYDGATGALMFDADGVGGAAAVQFATLAGAPVIAAGDFFVV